MNVEDFQAKVAARAAIALEKAQKAEAEAVKKGWDQEAKVREADYKPALTYEGDKAPDWKDRLRAEYQEVLDRYVKLQVALVKSLPGVSPAERDLLYLQYSVMATYLQILSLRVNRLAKTT